MQSLLPHKRTDRIGGEQPVLVIARAAWLRHDEKIPGLFRRRQSPVRMDCIGDEK